MLITKLPSHPHLQDVQPFYRDFRAGNMRQSLASMKTTGAIK